MSKYSDSPTLVINDQPLILDSESEAGTYVLTNVKTNKTRPCSIQVKSKSWHCPYQTPIAPILQLQRHSMDMKSNKPPIETATRDMLEIMLTRKQIKECDVLELQKKLHKKYEHMQEILDALLQYIDCLSLEKKASVRLTKQLNKLALDEDVLGQSESMQQMIINLTKHIDIDFYSVKSKIYKVMKDTDELDELFAEYKDRKNDFNKGIQNFKIILDTQKLNAFQINRLRKQFEVIQMNFKHSRCVLDHKLPEIIRERRKAMLDCLEVLQEQVNKIARDRSYMSLLFEDLESALKSTSDEIIDDVNDWSVS